MRCLPSTYGPLECAVDPEDGAGGAMQDDCPPLHGPLDDMMSAPPSGFGTAIET